MIRPVLIDTHAHLYEDVFIEDRAEMILRMQSAGVAKAFLPNVDDTTIEPLLNLCNRYPELFIPMMGLHPCSVKENWKYSIAIIEKALFTAPTRYAAIGEVGLDYYWDKTFIPMQQEAMILQAEWANELNLPVILHSRNSMDDLILLLSRKIKVNRTGIFHCFTGSLEQAKRIIDMGYYLGIGGVVTFKNANLPEVLKAIGPERLVLETDAPYLSPTPHRGKRNESSFITLVAAKLAEIFEMPFSKIAEITTRNALKIFNQSDLSIE
ncbi:MAG: TatD family hydrolase [Flavobacteriales bacterium]|nr:TatD family hydrolase [Flavobacteriales bacterium]